MECSSVIGGTSERTRICVHMCMEMVNGRNASGWMGLRKPSSRLSAMTPTICIQLVESGAAKLNGGSSRRSGTRKEWPTGSPLGK